MVLDVIIVIVSLLTIFIGYKMGFIKFVVNLASVFAGLLITSFLITPVHSFVVDSSIGQKQIDAIYLQIEGKETLSEMLGSLDMPSVIVLVLEMVVNVDDTSTNFALEVATNIGSKILWVECFIGLFIAFTILMFIIKRLADVMRNLTLFRIIDGLVGLIFVFLLVQTISYVVVTGGILLSEYGIYSGLEEYFLSQHESSLGLFKFYYEHNFVYNLVKLFI